MTEPSKPSSPRQTNEGNEHLVAAAARELARINTQAKDARAELAALKRELAQARQALTESRVGHLVEANEHLVLAALKAQEVADTARGDLDALAHANQRDSLTGLPNRVLMLDRLENGIVLSQRRGLRLAVLFFDLDGFKRVNDSRGHAVGDAVLCEVARCMSAAVRKSDTVSRHGGDEFLLLLAEVMAPSDAARVAAKILSALNEPDRFGDLAIHLTASVGIALYPEDGKDATKLIDRADAAMYRAKQEGGGRYEFHAGAGRSV